MQNHGVLIKIVPSFIKYIQIISEAMDLVSILQFQNLEGPAPKWELEMNYIYLELDQQTVIFRLSEVQCY